MNRNMNHLRTTCLALIFCSAVSAIELPAKFDYTTEFPDLIKDPYTAKLLDIWFNSSAYYSTSTLGDERAREARAWFGMQDGKAFPVFLEIFNRLESFEEKNRIINYFSSNPGDKSDFLKAARLELEVIPHRDEKTMPEIEYLYFRKLMSLIGADGMHEDLSLLEKLSNHESSYIRFESKIQINRLEENLEKRKVREPRRLDTGQSPESEHQKNRETSKEPSGEPILRTTGIVVGTIVLLLTIVRLLRKARSVQRPADRDRSATRK
jgi:hypothetical protein